MRSYFRLECPLRQHSLQPQEWYYRCRVDRQHDKIDTLDTTYSVEQKTQICASFLLSETDGERDDVACVTLSYIVY